MYEMQFGQGVNAQPLTQLITQKSRGSLQAFECVLHGCRIINERGEEDFRVRVVWGELNFGQRDHADAWIFEFHSDQFGEIALDLICDALASAGDGFTVLGHENLQFKDTGSPLAGRAMAITPLPFRRQTACGLKHLLHPAPG